MEFHGRDLARESRSQPIYRARSPSCFYILHTFGRATTTCPISSASPDPSQHTRHGVSSLCPTTLANPPIPGTQDTCACGRWCSEWDTLGTSGTFLRKVVPRTGHLQHSPVQRSRHSLPRRKRNRPCPCFRDIWERSQEGVCTWSPPVLHPDTY